MNTKKKMVAVITLIFFVCALLLGMNTVFSLSAVEVDFYLMSDRSKTLAQEIQNSIDEAYLGRSIFFIDEQEVCSKFDVSPYLTVKACKKDYPSSIKIMVEEKTEVFAFSAVYAGEEQYFMSDINGEILTREKKNVNYADGGENFVISGLQYDLTEGFTADKNYEYVMTACQLADNIMGGIRTCLSSLTVYAPTSNDADTEFIVKTVEGVTIRIARPAVMTEKKIKEGLEFYKSLSDENKLFGNVYVVEDALQANELRISYMV